MCLRSLGKDIAVFNGPVPTGRPVLTFGSVGDHTWV